MIDAIKIKGLVKRFGDITAVDDLNLNIMKGEIFGLLGPNGAGKTTIINILSGLLEPTSGSAEVAGYDIKTQSMDVKGLIGVCPQHSAYYKYLTGRENIELFGDLHGMPKKLLRERTEYLLENIALMEMADRKTGNYSGGMIRRVNLAMALIHDPEIAFLDEPTVAMDPQSRRATWDFIRDFRKREKTVILTTHYIEEAENLADRVGIIDHGKLIALDTPCSLMDKHGHENLEDVFITLTGRKIREDV
ncbi:MAG: ATP-binding cassette domain-containing protein [Candidatus Bathyarchaeota archaeon]|nr:ATP-binding cassette domain-containing protein [Candidatus Bathyarchaeota archaeon]